MSTTPCTLVIWLCAALRDWPILSTTLCTLVILLNLIMIIIEIAFSKYIKEIKKELDGLKNELKKING